jgi:hypothetical protein
MDNEERYKQLVFATGIVAGALSDPDLFARFVDALSSKQLSREYIVFARDSLDRALINSSKAADDGPEEGRRNAADR